TVAVHQVLRALFTQSSAGLFLLQGGHADVALGRIRYLDGGEKDLLDAPELGIHPTTSGCAATRVSAFRARFVSGRGEEVSAVPAGLAEATAADSRGFRLRSAVRSASSASCPGSARRRLAQTPCRRRPSPTSGPPTRRFATRCPGRDSSRVD